MRNFHRVAITGADTHPPRAIGEPLDQSIGDIAHRNDRGNRHAPFTGAAEKGQLLRVPIAHGEGCYIADERTLDELEAEDRVVFRYLDNPNGSERDIAGILNRERNVMGMMPHPERASDPLMGSTDGLVVFRSMVSALALQL